MALEKSKNNFIIEAEKFCLFLEKIKIFDENKCHQILINLTEIYSKAITLKAPKEDDISDIHIEVDRLFIDFGKYDTYSQVYNPYNDEEVVCGSLKDDFSDIYKELKTGLKLYEQGMKNDADYQMWWSFNYHWCYHAVDALRALNAIYADLCAKIK